ncbi:MAG: glycosyltransferase [Kiritimatiellae bacterium]|nr:glycosyltransferase [Kiritimatiellia bacterium]
MTFSVIIPAHNEATCLPSCLAAVAEAAKCHGASTEIIVVLNRCTDDTEQIALNHGARIVREDRRNIAAIRNAGVRAAGGDVVVTVDADSNVSRNLLAEIETVLASGKCVGGGINIRFERMSLGIAVSWALLSLALFFTRLSGGVFWCRLDDFRAIGGFDESLSFAEDMDFARRLRAHGRKNGRQFRRLPHAHIVTSCRKFDRFGDWFVLRQIFFGSREIRNGLRGTSTTFQDRVFYDFNLTQPDGAGLPGSHGS